MKTVQIVVLLLLSTSYLFGQKSVQPNFTQTQSETSEYQASKGAFFYLFSDYQTPFQPLTGGISVNEGRTWDDPIIVIPLGFTFRFFEATVDTLYLRPLGGGLALVHDTTTKGVAPVMMLYGVNLADRALDVLPLVGMQGSESPISYLTTGEKGARMCTIEFQNAGFRGDVYDNFQSVDHVTFQIRLFEMQDIIELHMGDTQISQPQLAYDGKSGPSIGLMPAFDFHTELMMEPGLWVMGLPYVPMAVISDTATQITGDIPMNHVYRFDREARNDPNTPNTPTNIEETDPTFASYPNPAQDYLQVSWGGAQGVIQAQVLNIQGQPVLSQEIMTEGSLNVSDLRAGMYILKCQDKEHTIYTRWMKR
ncbi:MAG: T9SS type A sorting domain-containing protein [Bacteroidota bacterium]